ncbi:hypothetical protein ACMSIO_01325 [Pseudomonas benzopyrenica]|uniref:hypothetical protein n=1 Tax=Pseudomonas benzopyrenica TaxID=2993566 RepID=UPI0039C483BD
MDKTTLSEVIVDATRLLESGELSDDESKVICEMIRDLIGQKTLACTTPMQQDWLVAKAWSVATGKTGFVRGPNSRSTDNFARVRKMLSELKNS